MVIVKSLHTLIREDSQIDFAAGNVFCMFFFWGGGRGFYASQILAIIDFFKHWKNLISKEEYYKIT